MSKFFKIIINSFLCLLVLIAVFVVFLMVWAKGEQKEIPAQIISHIENAFEALSPNIQVYVGEAKTEFLGLNQGFEIVLNESYIQLGPEVFASAPQMKMQIKLKDLIFFDVKLGELKLIDPQFVISGNNDKEKNGISSGDSVLSIYKAVIYELFAAIDKENNVIPVERVEVENAKISFNNNGAYETWYLNKASLKFFKLQSSTYLQTSVQTKIYDNLVDVSSKARLLDNGRMMVEIDFSNLPSKITNLFVDDVEWLNDLDINLSGKSQLVMSKKNSESSISLDTGFKFNKKGLGDIELGYKGALNLVLEDGIISPIFRSDVTLKNLDMAKLSELWPQNYGGDVREDFLRSVSNGVYEEVKVSVEFGFEDLNFNSVTSEEYSVSGTISDADVIFNPRYPTIQNVDGYFEFDGDNVFGQIDKASIKDGLNFADARLDVSNVNSEVSILEVQGDISGNIIAIKHIVSAALKGKDKEHFYNTRQITALGKGEFYYKDDINDGFNYKHTKLEVESQITNLEVKDVIENINFTSDDASLIVDENGLDLHSFGNLNNSLADLKLWVGFKGENNYRINLKSDAKSEDVSMIIPDYEKYFSGEAGLEFEYKSEGDKNSIIGNINLEDVGVNFPYISWMKNKGEFANLSLIGRNIDFRVLDIKSMQLTTADSVSKARALIAIDSKSPHEIYFNRLKVADNDAELYYNSSKIFDDKGKKAGVANIVKITGNQFNAKGLIKDFQSEESDGRSDLSLNVKVDKLLMRSNIILQNFVAKLKCVTSGCISGKSSGEFVSNGNINMSISPEDHANPMGRAIFNLETDNVGAMLKGFGITNNIEGGFARVSSVVDGGYNGETRGDIYMQNYQIVKAPVLAKIFSLASFSGISEILTGSGIPMKKLNGKFRMNRKYISFEDITSSGNSLGITSQGRYNISSSEIDLSGAVTPSYSINSFLGRIPILGKIFTASEGEGLIAAKYRLQGKQPNIDVSVNPLSALTPGFLRKIWGNSSTNINQKESDDKSGKYKSKFPKKRH